MRTRCLGHTGAFDLELDMRCAQHYTYITISLLHIFSLLDVSIFGMYRFSMGLSMQAWPRFQQSCVEDVRANCIPQRL